MLENRDITRRMMTPVMWQIWILLYELHQQLLLQAPTHWAFFKKKIILELSCDLFCLFIAASFLKLSNAARDNTTAVKLNCPAVVNGAPHQIKTGICFLSRYSTTSMMFFIKHWINKKKKCLRTCFSHRSKAL